MRPDRAGSTPGPHARLRGQAPQPVPRAGEAFESSRRLSTYRRREVLRAVAAGIRERSDELAELICAEAGKPIAFARGEVGRAVSTFMLAADELSRFGGEVVPVDIEEAFEGYQAHPAIKAPIAV